MLPRNAQVDVNYIVHINSYHYQAIAEVGRVTPPLWKYVHTLFQISQSLYDLFCPSRPPWIFILISLRLYKNVVGCLDGSVG